ncbi:FtsH protease activity modulator HflK [Luteolibacter marinus]|uniref:FtsH protease activity modulator HflK n=1 Tax=Luteolibacter marinus TaxID=2776705 RepID=UPI0018662F16|nr:FtsH protease activity modulator HflK [Luteolibacter marinus]
MPSPPSLPQFRSTQLKIGPILRVLVVIPVIVLLISGVFSSFYTVSPEAVAVVQRFGKFTGIADPGLHFKIPFGIDTATLVPIRRQLKLEFGFATRGATNPDQASEEPDRERDMVTGDLNAAQVEWIIQYGISDPKDFLFNVRNPGPTLRDLTESVMREVVGDRTVDEVLTIGRTEIETETLARLQQLMAKINMGLRVEQIQLKNVNPPGPVQSSFDEVNRAQQEREQMINEANGEYNRIIPKARGLAEQKISGAEGFAVQRVNEAQGDVTRFQQMLEQYEKAPAITKKRLYFETMKEVLPRLGGKIILDEDAKQFLPLMNLNQGIGPAAPPAQR